MCGLFGVIRHLGLAPSDTDRVTALGDQLRHRGPDGSGYIREDRALLGMHRLSIMDPARGWQPFWSEDRRWGVLGNGEIYNASDLRAKLIAHGHQISTGSDIEVIPHLLEEFNTEAFAQLRGMFALVVYDRVSDDVILVRDRLGEKPLCYWQGDGAVFISSEQSALVRSGIVPLEVDHNALYGYLLHGFTPEPASLIAGVRKVPAGHYLRISDVSGSITEHRYWNPRDDVSDQPLSDDDLASALEEAIVSTCTSDVPVGIALSGGLDSSLVAAVAANARTDLRAFTVGYETSSQDESEQARALANQLGIPCHTTTLRTSDIAREFARVCGDRDEPISDIAGPAIASLPRAAQETGVPVLLTGIGGDELFWGYDWMRQLAVWTSSYLSQGSIKGLGHFPRFTPFPRVLQAQVDWVSDLGGLLTDYQLRDFMKRGSDAVTVPLPFYEFQPSYRSIRRGLEELLPGESSHFHAEFRGPDIAAWAPALYTIASNDTYLRVNSFVQVDRLSMKYSVESRTPLADSTLVSTILSGRLASDDYLKPPKARMKEVARRFLPNEVVDRPKRGFTPPVREWAGALWRENEDARSAELTSTLTGLNQNTSRKWLMSPTTGSGRMNQIALRLMTLELWLRSLA